MQIANKKITIITVMIVAVLTFMVFLPALNNDFINWDDNKYIYENNYVKNLNGVFFRWAFLGFSGHDTDYWMPLSYLSHALVYTMSGVDPAGHHLANNIIHALNSILVVLLASMLIQASKGSESETAGNVTASTLMAAATTGLLFGIHPLRVESVAWISERKDILSAFFYLLAMISYSGYAVEMRKGTAPNSSSMSNRKYILALVFFAMALMSKPIAVSLPLVLLILDWYPMGRIETLKGFRRALTEKLPFFIFAVASSLITMLAQKDSSVIRSVEHVPFLMRLLVACRALTDYIWKMIMPADLVPWYDYPADTGLFSFGYGLPLLGVILVISACIYMKKRNRLYISALGYFVITLLPVLGLLVPTPVIMADRYTYLSGLGPLLIVGLAVSKGFTSISASGRWRLFLKAGMVVLGMAVLLSLTSATIKQIGKWKNSIVFWSYFIEKTSGQRANYFNYIGMAHNNLGNAYTEDGRVEDAIKEYFEALKNQNNYLNINNYILYSHIHNNLGYAFVKQGRFEEAGVEYLSSLKFDKYNTVVHYNLADSYIKRGMFDEAIREYKNILTIDPFHAAAVYNLGEVYVKRGMIDEAISVYKIRLRTFPYDISAHFNLGMICMENGFNDMARTEFESILKINPNHYWARQMLQSIPRR